MTEMTYKLEAGEELVCTAGIVGCVVIVKVIEGSIDLEVASELLRLRQLERALHGDTLDKSTQGKARGTGGAS